jgi:peptidoglycan/LPS O-acetylase OafA/YrhL
MSNEWMKYDCKAHDISPRLGPSFLSVGYRPDIDGLRAIAVLSVVVFHAFPSLLRGGFVGVDVFFVISGFLISSLTMREIDAGTFTLKCFYARRVRRIFPALILVLFFCFVAGWIALTPDEYKQLARHTVGGAMFVDNFVFWKEAGYFDNAADTKPLLHLWSLSIEEQFYLAWPPLLLLLWHRSRSLTLPLLATIVASLAFSIGTVRHDVVADFYSPLTRLWELMVGGALAYALIRKPELGIEFRRGFAWMGLLMILLAATCIDGEDRFPGAWSLLPAMGAAFVIFGGNANTWLNRRVLSSTPLVWIGLISYPLYLWHWPLLSFSRIFESETASTMTRLLLLAVSLVLAWLTYLLVERPIRFGSLSKKAVPILCACMASLLVAGVTVKTLDGVKTRHPSMLNGDTETLALGADRARLKRQCGINDVSMALFKHPYCLEDSRQEPRYAILGDSKAEALFYGLVRESKPGNRWLLIGSAIPPAENVGTSRQPDQSEIAYEAVEKMQQVKVVVLTNALRSTFSIDGDTGFIKTGIPPALVDSWIARYTRAIKRFERAGKSVIFVIDNPTFPDPRSCISGGLTESATLNRFLYRKESPRCTLRYTDFLAGTQLYREFVQKLKQANPALIIYDPTMELCEVAANVCAVKRGRNFLYSYGDHISDYANSLIAKDMLSVTDALSP